MCRSFGATCVYGHYGHKVLPVFATNGNLSCCSSATNFSAKLTETSVPTGIWPLFCNSPVNYFFSLQTSSQAGHCSGLELGPWHSSLGCEKEHCTLFFSGFLQTSEHFQMDGGLPQCSKERDCAWEGDSEVFPTPKSHCF